VGTRTVSGRWAPAAVANDADATVSAIIKPAIKRRLTHPSERDDFVYNRHAFLASILVVDTIGPRHIFYTDSR